MDYPSGYNVFLEAFACGLEPHRPIPMVGASRRSIVDNRPDIPRA
jgi:hypothetical protein